MNEAAEREIRRGVRGRQSLHGRRTSFVAERQPLLDGAPVVRDAGAETHRRFHDVHGNRAAEKIRHSDVQFLSPLFSSHFLCKSLWFMKKCFIKVRESKWGRCDAVLVNRYKSVYFAS